MIEHQDLRGIRDREGLDAAVAHAPLHMQRCDHDDEEQSVPDLDHHLHEHRQSDAIDQCAHPPLPFPCGLCCAKALQIIHDTYYNTDGAVLQEEEAFWAKKEGRIFFLKGDDSAGGQESA